MSSALKLFPLNLNWTPATSTLSNAVAFTKTNEPEITELFAGEISDTDGGIRSLKLFTLAKTVFVFAEKSVATALMLWYPFGAVDEFHKIEYGALVSSAPKLMLLILNCTPATPTLSAEFAVILTKPETFELLAGLIIEIFGGTTSAFSTYAMTGIEAFEFDEKSVAAAVNV